ncbi:MAG: hypothetical protein ACSLFM_02965 [Tepidiformaceae bacterium]
MEHGNRPGALAALRVASIRWVAVCTIIAAGLGAIWWALLDPAPEFIDELVIPAGTADRVAAGEPAPFIPSALSLGPGRELRIRNEDRVAHSVGTAELPPGAIAVLTAPDGDGAFSCTIHPGGSIGYTVTGRAGILPTIAWPALLLGIPAGLLIGAIVTLTARLDSHPAPV